MGFDLNYPSVENIEGIDLNIPLDGCDDILCADTQFTGSHRVGDDHIGGGCGTGNDDGCSNLQRGSGSCRSEDSTHSINGSQLGKNGDTTLTDIKDFEGVEFSSVDEAYEAYCMFAHYRGFSVRIQYEKGRVGDEKIIRYMQYCCNKQGYRETSYINPRNSNTASKTFVGESSRSQVRNTDETRTGCLAMIRFKYNDVANAYVASKFQDDHNHVLHDNSTRHLLKSNRIIDMHKRVIADVNDKAGLSLKSSFNIMAVVSGGEKNVGFLKRDLKNMLRSSRKNMLKSGDASNMMRYFREKSCVDPDFFHEVDVDNDNQITNIFWADAKMRSDYSIFGDSVSFDTTFNTNKNARPLALFVGFNHHRQCCVFGAALMIDETTESFVWLLQTFLKCMRGVEPKTIMTDQDAAMAAAIKDVIPGAYHGLCTWHIIENAKKNLSRQYTDKFDKMFHSLVYKVLNEYEFDEQWKDMVNSCFNGNPHRWLDGIYPLRKKWSAAWRRMQFTTGMRTTQISESTNASLKRYLQVDHNIAQFFVHFDRAIETRRSEELEQDFATNDRNLGARYAANPLVASVSSSYTRAVFDIFCKEYNDSQKYSIKGFGDESGDGTTIYTVYNPLKEAIGGRLHRVKMNPSLSNVSCTCCKFKNFGVLCRHALRAMEIIGSFFCPEFRTVPPKYICERWSRDANKKVANNPPEQLQVKDMTTERCRALTSYITASSNLITRDDETFRKFMCHVDKFLADVNKGSTCAQEHIDSNCQEKGYTLKRKERKMGQRKRQVSISKACREKKQKTTTNKYMVHN